jgi:hypothetical protein
MNHSRAVPIQFITTHIKSLVPRIGSQFADFQTRQVAELFNWYQDISANVARLRAILFGDSRSEYSLTRSQEDILRSNAAQYATAMNDIYDAARFCFISGEVSRCQLPPNATSLNPIHWPKESDNIKCEQLREFALSSGLIENNDEYRMAASRNFAPHIVFSEDMRGSISGWHRCEDLLANGF